jgi:3-isopropylmalate/(R)-2-methylmalate dehydratase small subunit
MAKYENLIADEGCLLATTGRAWAFGDHVAGEQILTAEHLDQSPQAARAFVLSRLDPTFASRVAAGDFVVAGVDFAVGASHRVVPAAFKALGVAALIARSFGSVFLRNAIDVGLPVLVVEETAAIKTGDYLRVDVEAHVVANLSSGDRYVVRNLDDEAMAILRAGGIVPYARKRVEPAT